ncbi:MAG TPA: hypothetical protein VIL88_14085 [Devosia sp.]|uniref:hypothetical protein n=1 Tax=Devosia sp. TaxID=1871048 RepID=UPI002F932508
MPTFFRHLPRLQQDHAVALRIFSLPEGLSCVVSWRLPEPGLRVFSPKALPSRSVEEALPYAKYLCEHLGTCRIAVEIDDDVEWDPSWGELVDLQ